MPVRTRFCLFAVLVTACLIVGCCPPAYLRHGTGPIRIDNRFNRGRIAMNVGQIVLVSLPANAAGYCWMLVENPTDLLRPEGETGFSVLEPGEARFGSTPRFETFRFVAQGTGETSIELWCRHPDKPNELPANTFNVTIDIHAD
ncbi:MAG: protease inhibitor I42 family protein [bacterium]